MPGTAGAYAIAADARIGNVYVLGQAQAGSSTLVVYDSDGTELWTVDNVVPDTGNGYAQAIAVDATSVTIYATGFTQMGTRNKFATIAYSPFSTSP